MAPKKKTRRLYLDTSILGFSIYKDDLTRRVEANELLRQIRNGLFLGGYSYVTETEISAAPARVAARLRRKITFARLRRVHVRSRSLAHELAMVYCKAGVIPEAFLEDALHVAVATLWRADALVSFNFTHLVRLDTMLEVNRINRVRGLAELFLCRPVRSLFHEKIGSALRVFSMWPGYWLRQSLGMRLLPAPLSKQLAPADTRRCKGKTCARSGPSGPRLSKKRSRFP